jgi:hypothetical protein
MCSPHGATVKERAVHAPFNFEGAPLDSRTVGGSIHVGALVTNSAAVLRKSVNLGSGAESDVFPGAPGQDPFHA